MPAHVRQRLSAIHVNPRRQLRRIETGCVTKTWYPGSRRPTSRQQGIQLRLGLGPVLRAEQLVPVIATEPKVVLCPSTLALVLAVASRPSTTHSPSRRMTRVREYPTRRLGSRSIQTTPPEADVQRGPGCRPRSTVFRCINADHAGP
jgi:hypothetical protein